MRHTIDEAASLVGRTRRSLYRAMTEGRLAYSLEHDGRRYIDTTELLRVYGPFDAPSQAVTPEMSHGVTLPADLAELIAKAVSQAVGKAVAEAVEPLRLELERLRLEQRRIEHKPTTDSPPGPQTAPQSFADLLASLDG